MRKSLFVILLLAVAGVYSCSTDFDINTDWKEITILYGILDPSEPNQYVRVNKAFLDDNTSALEIAQIPDSVYYQNPAVLLKGYNASGTLQHTYSMEQVEGADEGTPKEEGVFVNDPHYLYKTDGGINPAFRYDIEVTTDLGNTASASSPIVEDFDIKSPKSSTILNLTGTSFDVKWEKPENGTIYNLSAIFAYREYPISDPNQVEFHSLEWLVFSNLTDVGVGSELAEFKVPSENVYNFIANSLEPKEGFIREFQSLDFRIFSGSEELQRFYQVSLAAQSTITSGQAATAYTNVENGLGLFASRNKTSVRVTGLTAGSKDLLGCGPITGHLNFAPDPGNDAYPFCN